ncbi:uncharacterized protein [Anabrus simplex]
MTHSQESRVSSSQDTFRLTEESISSVSALVNRLNSCLAVGTDVFDESSNKLEKMAATSNQDEKKLEATFPWLATFWDLCQAALGSRSIKRLENLLSFYLGNVTANVKDCYMKPNRAAKLRKCMNESLAYFHLFYQDIREPMEHSSYLDKMTDLVSMYMDMEIKASRRRKESLKKIACRLSSSLYIFLDNSEDHILDAILKAKLVNKNYREVCIPLLGKILNNMRTYPLYEMLYVRYLLVFKIWKKVVADPEERKHINKIAVQKLNPPPNFMEKSKIFNNVLPRIPKSKKNITLFFMQAKFNLKNACTAFLKGCKDSQQSGFSQTLSVNMDKPNFFNERLDQVPDKENMTNTGGSNLIEDIWSSLSNPESGLTENSQLQELSRNKSKPDQLTGKRKKEKCKKKQKKKDKAGKKKDKLLEKGKKKKKKILSGNGDSASVLSDTTFGVTSLLKKSGKGEKAKKKKKKKSPNINLEPSLLAPCDAGAEESVCMLESNGVADSASAAISEAVPQPTSQDLIQAASQVLVQAVGNAIVEESVPQKSILPSAIVPDGTSEVKAEVDMESRMEVCVDTEAEAQTRNSASSISLGHSQVMVNKVNSAGESLIDSVVKEVYSEEGKKYADKFNDPESLNQVNQVNSVGCLDESQEQVRVTVIATGGRDPIVPSSSCNILEGLAASQKPALVSQENEAIASEVNKKSDDMSVDAVLPRTVRDPILVPSQTSCDPEAVSYACDSSIKNEIPISEEGAPVGSDDFNSVPMEIDSDVEILAELRPQVTVKCGGVAEEEIVLSDDGEIMRQESQLDNIFATENADLVIEMLGGVLPGGLQVPSIELNSSTHSEEGGEPESPEIETFDVYETLSLNDMMNNFLRSKGDFSQYGGERRDCLYRDSMLHPATQSNYDRLAALQGSVNAHQFMEDDECEEATTDDELESCYELSHSHSSYAHSKRPCIKGGKVGFNGAVSSNGYASVGVNEKEVSGGSPSSSVENDNTLDSTVPSKNSFISSRNNLFNSASDSIATVSGRDTPSHPHVGLETTALSSARNPTSSTPKRLSDVNTMRYYTSTLDQPVQSESVEDRTENTSLDKSLHKRPSTPKKTPSSTSTVQHTQGVLPRVVDSSFMNRRVSVQLTQLSPDSASGGFPDVVLDAHKVSGQREKETMKPPSRGMLPEAPNVRGKLPRPYGDGLYRGVPLSAPNVPTSIPYPAITAPLAVCKPQLALGQYVRCTCSECYISHVLYLSRYNSTPPVGERFPTVPLEYHDSSVGTNVEKLKSAEKIKSEDEALLRRIERSLTSDTKLKTEDDDLESKFKPELDSSLPLKKRLKTLTHITEIKVKPETNDSTKTESFPSYPTRPMISIAELDFNKSLLTKQLQRPIKTPNSSQRYMQYPNMNYYQTQIQNMRKMHDFVTQYRQYSTDVAGSQAENGVSSSNRESSSYTGNITISEAPNEKVSSRYQQQMPKELYLTKDRLANECNKEDNSIIGHSNSTLNCYEYSGRQFKTPAQLKEIPPNTVPQYRDVSVMKPDPNRSQVTTSSELTVAVSKQEVASDLKAAHSQYNKLHALDLSIDDSVHTSENQKSHRKKKKHSESRSRSSKRSNSSRSHSVIQNAETVDDFMKSFEKKRRRKHSR